MKTHAQRREEISSGAHGRQPAVRSPGPVANDRIDETGNTEAVEEVPDKPGAADHRARGNGRAGISKGELENPDGEERHAGGLIGQRRVLQEEPVIADKAVAVGEHKCKADGVEENAAETGIHHALYKHVHGFAGATEAGLEHRESNLHAEYKECRN